MIRLNEIGWMEERFSRSRLRYLLPAIMLFLSWMMISEVKYPTFKRLDLRATKTFTKTLVAVMLIGSVVVLREKILFWVLPLFFTTYLIYGFIRPRVSRRVREEIEDEDEDEPSSPA